MAERRFTLSAARSHPARGAWIEISRFSFLAHQPCRRTPHGVRGLKYLILDHLLELCGPSHPARGAWIEIENVADS